MFSQYVVAAAEVRQAADDFEADAVQQDGRTHGRAPGKQRLLQLVSQDDHVAPLRSSSSFSQRPSLSGKIADLVQLGLGAQDFAVWRWRIR